MYLFRLYIFILSLAAGAALMFAAPLAAQTPSAAALTEDPLPDGRARVVVEAADTTGRPLQRPTAAYMPPRPSATGVRSSRCRRGSTAWPWNI